MTPPGDRLVSTTTGHPLNGMTEPPLEQASRHQKNVDPPAANRLRRASATAAAARR